MQDAKLVREKGWDKFVNERWGWVDLTDMKEVDNPYRCLLHQYRHQEAPVVLTGMEMTEEERLQVLDHVIHKSTMSHVSFLRE